MKKQEKNKWKIAACIMLLLELAGIATAMVMLSMLNMLPIEYMLIVGVVLLLLLALSYKFLFARQKKDHKKRLILKRVIGCIIVMVLVCLCVVTSAVSAVGLDKMSSLFGNKEVTVEEVTAAYVLEKDDAKTIADAQEYVFGITDSYDWENTQEAISKINSELQVDIQTKKYDSVHEMVDALYAQEVGAILLNTAYVSILEDQEEYEDYSDRTRVLFESTIRTVQEVEDNSKDETQDAFVVYISGSDTRSNKLTKSRSDVNVLAVVNPETKQILLVNTPRDYYVPISIGNGAKDKLTHCGLYGVNCSMKTLGNLYDVEVDHYGQINFTGFETLIDAIGGVKVYSEKTFRTREGHYQLYEGENQMSGAVALAFVRDRYAFSDGDNARGRHQMAVIAAVVDKLSASTVLKNYSEIMDSIEGMFTTDFSSDEISALVKMQLADGAKWNVKTFAVSGKGGKETTYSVPNKRAYVMYPDDSSVEFAKKLIKKVQDGEILSDDDLVISEENGQSE